MSDQLCPGCPGDPNETCCKPELRVKVWMDKQKADMSDQKTEQKPEHEKRIREALEALPAIAEWSSDELGVWMVDDPFDTFVCAAEDVDEAAFIAACNPSAIRALLAELDAMRGVLEAIVNSAAAGQASIIEHLVSDARAALKGASA